MKYAIMSDAHSNPAALELALKDAKKRKCEKFVFLGDTTGYGYDVKTTLKLVKDSFDVVVMGNHDAVCSGLDNDKYTRINAHYDIDRAQGQVIAEADIDWLRKLKLGYKSRDFLGVHGDFIDPRSWGYIIEPEEVWLNFTANEERVMFCGHSHHATVWELKGGKKLANKFEEKFRKPATEAESITFKLSPENRYIINVGSVGYPRHDLCSTYAIFDSVAQRVTIRRLPFDFKGYIKAMLAAKIDLPQWLQEILIIARAKMNG